MLEQLRGFAEKQKAMLAQFRAEAKDLLEPTLRDFMKDHPDIKAVGWTQYTPFFNDGEPCVFRFNEISASVEDERGDSLYDESWTELYGDPKPGFSAASWTALKELNKTLCAMTDSLEAVFGDHCKVTVTREGVDVSEYDHD